jgi:hypothetical protein
MEVGQIISIYTYATGLEKAEVLKADYTTYSIPMLTVEVLGGRFKGETLAIQK